MEIIKFETIGCPNCRKLSAILNVANLVPDRTVIISDENLDIAKKFNVQSFPTLLKLEEGKEIARISGLVPLSKLKEFFDV